MTAQRVWDGINGRSGRGPAASAARFAVLVLLALGAAAPPSQAAIRGAGGGGRCLESGTATLHSFTGPFNHRTGLITFTGTELACHMTDRSIHSGTVWGQATVVADCTPGMSFGGIDFGSYTVTWDNGRRTVVTYTEHLGAPSHPLGHTGGRVVRGEFRGRKTWDYDLDIPSPTICLIDSGLIDATWNGLAGIGVPDPGLEP
jgi:hypothetical protein